jgi:hypothetical protein
VRGESSEASRRFWKFSVHHRWVAARTQWCGAGVDVLIGEVGRDSLDGGTGVNCYKIGQKASRPSFSNVSSSFNDVLSAAMLEQFV